MSQPAWVVNQTPPPQAPAPVAWTLTEDGNGNIFLNAAVQGQAPVAVIALQTGATGGTLVREALNATYAAQFGIQIDASNKIVTN